MSALSDSKQFGAFGKDIITGTQNPDRVYHYIRAVGGDAVVNFTSESGTVFTGVTITTDDHDIYTDLEVTSGTVWAWLAAKPK